MFPEHTFRVLAPGTPIAHSDLCVDWVRLGNIAFKHSYLLENERLVRQSGLIHVQEGDEFLATNLIIHTIAVGVTCSVKCILAVEYCQVEVHRAVVSGLSEGMLNHIPLKCQIVRVFSVIAIAVE